MLSGRLPPVSLPVSGLQLSQPQHLHHFILEEKWVRDRRRKELNWSVKSLYFQAQPRSDLRRLHISEFGQEPDHGNFQFPRRFCFSQAGCQANHRSRLLHNDVCDFTSNIWIIFSWYFSAGYSCTFFALESVFGLVVLTMGACHGLGFIFVYTIANGTAQKWFPPEVRGLIASIVSR